MTLVKWCTQFSSVQSTQLCPILCDPMDCSTPGFLSIANSQRLFKPNSWSLSIKSVMPSNHLILCCPLLLLPSIFPSIRVFSSESVLCIRWSKYWSFSFSISPSSEYSGLRTPWTVWKAALSMPAKFENSAVATGLEKVSFYSNLKEGQ